VLEEGDAISAEGAAIGMWSNAWRALDAIGVGDALRSQFLPLGRVELTAAHGKLLRSFSLSECDAVARGGPPAGEFRGVNRTVLLDVLADTLPAGTIRFGEAVESVESSASTAPSAGGSSQAASESRPVLKLSSGQRLRCRMVVGADGVRSAVASHVGVQPPRYAGYVAYRGMATFPPGALPLPPDTVRQVWGAGVRAGMYPLNDSQLYWFTCLNAPADAPLPVSPEACFAEAIAPVRGWGWGLEAAISATPRENLTRSRIVDRWGAELDG